MKALIARLSLLAAVSLLTLNLAAQAPGMPGGGMDKMFSHLFGKTKSFSAEGEIKAAGTTIVMGFSMLEGKMRMETDLAKIQGAQIPAEMLNTMKEMGMDKMVNIVSADQKSMYLLYPGLKSYVEMPVPDDGTGGKEPTTETTKLGEETIDGQACVKNKVVLTSATGQKHEMTVWNAKELKDFPVQSEFVDGANKATMKFRNIKLTAPDAKAFEVPADFEKHAGMPQLMQSAMMKKMSASPTGK